MNISNFDDLSTDIQALVLSCLEARDLAYAPYSNFYVGASILTVDGELMQGANQENASYPLCLCAERVALSYAAMHRPGTEYLAMAVSTSANLTAEDIPAPPCGACRQVLLEYQERQETKITLYLVGHNNKVWIYEDIYALLPHSFQSNFLTK